MGSPHKSKVTNIMDKEKELLEQETVTPAISEESDNNFLALLPLKNVVLLPKSILPIVVARPSSIKSVEYALKHNKIIFISAQKDPDIEHPTENDIYQYGTRAVILQVMRTPNGQLKILVEGINRAKIVEAMQQDDFTGVYIEDLPTKKPKTKSEQEATWRTLKTLYTDYAKLNEKAPQDLIETDKSPADIDYVVDTIAVHLNLSFDERQNILETIDLKKRIFSLVLFLKKEIEILEVEQKIRGHIQTQVEKNQREYYLTEQIKAIHKELGREDQQSEFAQLREKIIKLKPTQEILEKVDKELKRLEQMPPLSSEAVVSRTYVDWIASIPWSHSTKDRISLAQAEKLLNTHHAGLKKVKERIIEFLAAKKFSKALERSPIVCLAGPPGVGKTSLAKSIAESLGRNFVRISLGGVKDEAEIRGHRRTYIGALPGKIIQAMKKAKSVNPVILLDEIDKMSVDMHGDPASALLEVLDPEQNKTFVDHFLDAEYDLSKVMFITTANHIDSIPYPLYDRMEIIHLSGYTNAEKLTIAKKFLMTKNLKAYGLEKTQFKMSEQLIETVIAHYTKEAGVRQLERVLAKIMRKAIQELLKDKKLKSITVTAELLRTWLGHPPFKQNRLEKEPKIGLATGLAWTELGGEIMETEVSVVPGKGGFMLTGQLGEVMQESGHAALSYIRSRVADLNIPKNFNSTKDIHIHLPEGATPKDGPSAGITLCTSIVSALTKNPVKPHIAMTGEITLRGRVLAIGGVKEKLLAAQQYGIKTVLIPHENKEDVEEVLKEADINLSIKFIKNMDQVLEYALTNPPFEKQVKVKKTTAKKTTKKRK
jgi:ATP-dependent Lon protease